MSIKKLLINLSLFIVDLLFVIIFCSLVNLLGLFNNIVNNIIFFTIININYLILGFILSRNKLRYSAYIYGIPIIIIFYIISLFIKPSINSLIFLIINYLCYFTGIVIREKIKKTNH